MPASAPKGWFKRWAFGFGRAGWILLGVLALVLVACWRGWDPIYGLQVIALECFGVSAMFQVALAYVFLGLGFACQFGIPSAALMIAASATASVRLSRWAVWATMLSSIAWGFRYYGTQVLTNLGWDSLASFAKAARNAVDPYPGVVLLAVCGGWLCRSYVVGIALTLIGLAGLFGYEALTNAWIAPGGLMAPGWEFVHATAVAAWHLAVLVPILLWAAIMRRKPIVPKPCPSCGYDLTGLTNSKCPECGAESPPAPSSALSVPLW